MRATPYVQVDIGVVDANITAMQVFCDARGIALRPHAKTDKRPASENWPNACR